MNFEQYQNLAARTVPPSYDERRKLDLARIGLIGELGEIAEMVKKSDHHSKPFTAESMIKECGDLLWYLALYCKTAGVVVDITFTKAAPVFRMPASRACIKMVKYVSILCDSDASRSHYAAYDLLFEIHRILTMHGTTLETAMEKNIEKLMVRYPEGFDLTISATHNSE